MRIAQITDLHARHFLPGNAIRSACESRTAFNLLPEALKLIAAWEPDLLAITGDILDVPLYTLRPTDYYAPDIAHWPELARKDYQAIKDILDASGLRTTVLPGNHDLDAAFWDVFDPEPRTFEIAGHTVARFYDREGFMHVPQRIHRERDLWEHLLTHPDAPENQVHLQHYVIEPHVEFWYPYNYRSAPDLRDRMAASGRVKLSLSGHYHDGTDLVRHPASHDASRATTFATGAVFGEFPYHITLYEIDGPDVHRTAITLRDHPVTANQPAAFISRELLLASPPDAGPELVAPHPGAAQALLDLKTAGFAIVLIAHDPWVGRGRITWRDQFTVYERLADQLVQQAGDNLDAQPDHIYTTQSAGADAALPDLADATEIPPSPALLEKAFLRHAFQPATSIVMTSDPAWRDAAEQLMIPTSDTLTPPA